MTDSDRLTRERAYALWEAEGRPSGREHDHWDRASREIEDEQSPAPGGEDVGGQDTDAVAEEAAPRPAARSRTAGSGTARRAAPARRKGA